jgi:cytochrome c nitrite reductase small subunit
VTGVPARLLQAIARRLPLLLVIAMGIAMGVALATFHYARGTSYLSTDPKACVNCHIMRPQYDSWTASTHHTVGCIECHLPADFVGKYIAKMENGYHHSRAFTMQDFAEPIRIKPKNMAILQANCKRCHADLVHEIAPAALDCVRCHATVGHGDRTGLGGPLRHTRQR